MPMKRVVTMDSAGKQIPLELDTNKTPGLSQWFPGSPPCVGWWDCRMAANPSADVLRRWWNGSVWSWPVRPGKDDSDYAEFMKHRESNLIPGCLLYRGLTSKPLYDYALIPTSEVRP